MLDKDNYPGRQSLKEIREWDILKKGIDGLLNLIKENTHWADRQISITGKKVLWFEYSTGGWSGNEDVIDALRQNYLFWLMYWQKSERGGHYFFKIKPIKCK